jgi:hypothetical protein
MGSGSPGNQGAAAGAMSSPLDPLGGALIGRSLGRNKGSRSSSSPGSIGAPDTGAINNMSLSNPTGAAPQAPTQTPWGNSWQNLQGPGKTPPSQAQSPATSQLPGNRMAQGKTPPQSPQLPGGSNNQTTTPGALLR